MPLYSMGEQWRRYQSCIVCTQFDVRSPHPLIDFSAGTSALKVRSQFLAHGIPSERLLYREILLGQPMPWPK